MLNILFLFLTTFLAAFVQSLTGFGFAIIIMALWPLLFSMLNSVFLSMFGSGIMMSYMSWLYRKYINFRIALPPLVISLLGTWLGLTLLVNVDNHLARRWLGALLIFLAVYLFFWADKIKVPDHWGVGLLVGAVSGLLGGFLNIPGPPIVVYMSVAIREKTEYIATLQFFFLVNYVFKLVFLLINAGIETVNLGYGAVVFTASIVGVLIGSRLFEKLSSGRVKEFTYLMMLLSGLWYLVG